MKPARLLFFTAACAACVAGGLAAGIAARRGSAASSATDAPAPGNTAHPVSPGPSSPATTARPVLPPLPRSTDTVATLSTLDAIALPLRLAHWLQDASAEDIAAWWQASSGCAGSPDLGQMVMMRWVRLDREAAFAAAAGDPSGEFYAWRAWACNDPGGALAAVLPDGRNLSMVLWTLAAFQNSWLREHFSEIPDGTGKSGVAGQISLLADPDDPLGALRFRRRTDGRLDQGSFLRLAQQDPWAALDFLRSNPDLLSAPSHTGTSEPGALETLAADMAASDLGELRRMAETLSAGEMRRTLDAALFTSLASTDPQAALEIARTTPGSRLATERFAALGMAQIASDPEAAFAAAASIFQLTPQALTGFGTLPVAGGGIRGWRDPIPGVSGLVDALLALDAARLMAMQPPPGSAPKGPMVDSFSVAATRFSETDPQGFAAWVDGQQDPAVVAGALPLLARQQARGGDYAAATDSAMQLSGVSRMATLFSVLGDWRRSDAAASRTWLERADIPDDLRSSLVHDLEMDRDTFIQSGPR